MKRYLSLTFAVLFFQLFTSCNNQQGNIKNKDSIKNGLVFKNNLVSYQFNFPDTVFINKSYTGKIKYKGILDSITTKIKFTDSISRQIYYSAVITEKLVKNINELKKQKFDTIDTDNSKEIILKNIKFDKPGTFYVDGFIKDEVYFPINKHNVDRKNLFRKIAKEYRVNHKVVVIEKEN